MRENIKIVLKEYLKVYDITQKELANEIKIPLPTLKKYLNGSLYPKEENFNKICNNLLLSDEILLNFDLSNEKQLKKALEYVTPYEAFDGLPNYMILNSLVKKMEEKEEKNINKNIDLLGLFDSKEDFNYKVQSKKDFFDDFRKAINKEYFNFFRIFNILVIEENEKKIIFKDTKENKTIVVENFEEIKKDIEKYIRFIFYTETTKNKK